MKYGKLVLVKQQQFKPSILWLLSIINDTWIICSPWHDVRILNNIEMLTFSGDKGEHS